MENEVKIRRFIRQALIDAAFTASLYESDRIMADIVRAEEISQIQNGEDKIDENCLDDRKLHGADKVLTKFNDRLK